jgi:glycogen synthase
MFGKKPPKILFVAAEVAPFASIGGLFDKNHPL